VDNIEVADEMKMRLLLFLALIGVVYAESGTLRIQSEPGAEVLWEGVFLAKIDSEGRLSVSGIPPGSFKVVVRKPGFRDFRTSVTLEADQSIVLDAPLEPISILAGETAREASPPPPGNETRKAVRARTDTGSLGSVKPGTSSLSSAREDRANRPEAEASETVAVSSREPGHQVAQEIAGSIPVWPFILGIAILALVLWFSRRVKPIASPPSPALLAYPDIPEPTRKPERTASFLSDLKKREELLEQGVEIVSPPKSPVIDLDAASVREVEDQ